MEKHQHMKDFISNALEYSKQRTEKTSNSLHRNLQILGVTSDMSIFDPGTSVAVEFYVSLHELMSTLESRSGLVWSAIGVLQHACRNPTARHALIHTYKFAPILTKLLGASLIQEKKIRVLQLLQELTYGVKISWQEAHLPYLISTLTSWIYSAEKEVISLSLGVLVNLCYKNLPAVYTLMRSVDIKQFLQTVLRLQHDINTRVQVCKLLIILQHVSGEIPDDEILKFVNITFLTVGDAFKTRDVFLLRHMVDFFKDVQLNPHSREVLLTYESFPTDTEQLLLLTNSETADPECVGMIFEFLHSLVNLKVTGLGRLYPRIITIAMKWIRTELACTRSLSLMRSVALDVRHNDDALAAEVQQNVMTQLEQDLTVLLLLLDVGGDENYPANSESRTRITALLQLLQEMSKTPILRQKILVAVKHQVIQRIFLPLISAEPREGDNFFQTEVVELYVHALDFMSDLASHDGQWLKLYSDLLQHRQVQMVLGVALYTGKENIKCKVLTLTGTVGFPAESVASLAKSLCELEPLVLVSSTDSVSKIQRSVESIDSCQHDMTPLFSLTQEGRLDKFIMTLEEALERNEIQDSSTSAVMELYRYKLAAMGHTERNLQASLEAANNHATHLLHRLAQVGAEASRLHQTLFQNQQSIEGLQKEKVAFITKIEAAQISAEEEHKKHLTEMKIKHRLINDLNNTLDDLKRDLLSKDEDLTVARQQIETMSKQVEELQAHITQLEQKTKDQTFKNSELCKTLGKLEERIGKREKVIEEKGHEIEALNKSIQELKIELTNFKMLCKGQEKTLREKEAEMSAIQLQLNELQRMREVIFEISGGRKKMDK